MVIRLHRYIANVFSIRLRFYPLTMVHQHRERAFELFFF